MDDIRKFPGRFPEEPYSNEIKGGICRSTEEARRATESTGEKGFRMNGGTWEEIWITAVLSEAAAAQNSRFLFI